MSLSNTPAAAAPQPPDSGRQRPTAPPAAPQTGRWSAAAFGLGLLGLVAVSFWTLDLQWAQFLSRDALHSMGRFIAEFVPPDLSPAFAHKVWVGTLETLAMSVLGTALAALAGLLLAAPASRRRDGLDPADGDGQGQSTALRALVRAAFNLLRAIPELVWAALLLVSAGLGPLAGTLALALHTTGVLGRLFAESLENAPPGPALALRTQGASGLRVLLYATLPQVLPQLLSYTLYRWENNIRAAAVLGVVGAGGLGQLLAFHLGLFHMGKTATILLAMLALVALVDGLSHLSRRWLTR